MLVLSVEPCVRLPFRQTTGQHHLKRNLIILRAIRHLTGKPEISRRPIASVKVLYRSRFVVHQSAQGALLILAIVCSEFYAIIVK